MMLSFQIAMNSFGALVLVAAVLGCEHTKVWTLKIMTGYYQHYSILSVISLFLRTVGEGVGAFLLYSKDAQP